MTTKKFSEIAVNTEFTYQNKLYKKVPEIRKSCCEFTNAEEVENPSNKIGVIPIAEVQIKEGLE